jgi:hypothetical protein
MPMNCYLSELDSNRFGLAIAKADGLESAEDVDAALRFCKGNRVAMLIARIDSDRLDLAHKLEASGALLCDTLVYFQLQTRNAAAPSETKGEFTVRQFRPEDKGTILDIAREAFSGYHGHYHSDPRLKKADSDAVYVSWCESSIDNAGAVHNVLVIENKSGVCGFLTTRVHEDSQFELVLGGMKKQFLGRGGYRRLIETGVRQAVTRGLERVLVSTQVSHRSVQRVWIALGFLPVKSVHTFHAWFTTKA